MDIMGVLVELLDPTQNNRFLDQYLDFPVDLSQVLFIATANNTPHVATAVLDRLELIQMPSYTDEEKIHITKNFILPRALKNAGLKPEQLTIDPSIWPLVVRPLGYDAGIRTLERTMSSVVRKVAKQVVEGSATSVLLGQDNYKQYMISY
jgi:ATP-dependent Lon protease